jgi:hypothetical protein
VGGGTEDNYDGDMQIIRDVSRREAHSFILFSGWSEDTDLSAHLRSAVSKIDKTNDWPAAGGIVS